MVNKKSKKSIAILTIIAIPILIIIIGMQYKKNDMLVNLTESQIDSIFLYSWGGMKQAELSKSETTDLVRQLNKIRLIGRGSDKFKNYGGGTWVMFRITLNDGSEFDFSAFDPFYIINAQIGYKANSMIAKEIQETYYALLGKYFP